ncbi:MAG: hypothetical protein ABJA20_16050 [Novosphingobium sp.]
MTMTLPQIERFKLTLPVATAQQIARNLLFGLRGLREAAQSVEDMREMVRLQVNLICYAFEVSGLPTSNTNA